MPPAEGGGMEIYMFKKQRKLLIGLMLLVATMFNGGEVSAATIGHNFTNPISVQSVNTASSRIGFSITNSGTASITAGIVGKVGTSKIQMTVKLQKYNSRSKSWKKVKSWNKQFNSTNASFSTSYKINSKGDYRCKLSAVVWKNGTGENINMFSVKKTY